VIQKDFAPVGCSCNGSQPSFTTMSSLAASLPDAFRGSSSAATDLRHGKVAGQLGTSTDAMAASVIDIDVGHAKRAHIRKVHWGRAQLSPIASLTCLSPKL
jgi:hypothetical protein